MTMTKPEIPQGGTNEGSTSRLKAFESIVLRISDLLSRVPFRLAQAGDPVTFFPLAAFLEQLQALEALQDVALAAQCSRGAETTML